MRSIFDLHADLLMDLTRRAEAGITGSPLAAELETRHLGRLRAGGIVGAVMTDCRMAGEPAAPEHLEAFIGTVRREFSATGSRVKQVLSAADLDEAFHSGAFAAIIGYEGLTATGGDLTWIERLYREAGLRVAVLTHNDDNVFGGGWKGTRGGLPGDAALGLTEQGRQAVALMNELGILVDMAHAGKATRADILAVSSRPVMLSHVLSKTVYDNGRNLSTEEARQIADRGGLIGCMTSPAALAPLADRFHHTLARYISHVMSLVHAAGVEHVGLGLHFCEYLYPPEVYPPVAGLEDASKSQAILEALAEAGLDTCSIEKIAWKNFVRVFKEAVG